MQEYIKIRGAKEHNLKNVDVDIPKNKLIVITGLSGSGKSSLAFDTIYAEGQRRYVESLSTYARQFLHLQNKPDVEMISGLSPAIAIDQKTTSKNPRSTVGTVTEIYDYLRLLYARIGVPYSPKTGLPLKSQSIAEMISIITALPKNTKIRILSPIARGKKGEFRRVFINLKKYGYQHLIIDNEIYQMHAIPPIDKNKTHNIEVVIEESQLLNLTTDSIEDSLVSALKLNNGIIYVDLLDLPSDHNTQYHVNQRIILSSQYSCSDSDFQIEEIEPRIFSFNSPFGACKACEGLGLESFFDPKLIVPDQNLTILEGAILPWRDASSKLFLETLASLARHYNFKMSCRFVDLPQKIKDVLFYGSHDELIEFEYKDGYKTKSMVHSFAGIIPSLEEKAIKLDAVASNDEFTKFQSKKKCTICHGYRLNIGALSVKIDKLNIGEITSKTISETQIWFGQLSNKLNENHVLIAQRVIKEIQARLEFLKNVGLGYLTLARSSATLSGGESQRIRLASQIGCGLSGVLYVLDEPSIGLHQRDNAKLIQTLKVLKDLGNTVIVVEHDDETMLASDHLIDVGPGAGINGGNIVAHGSPEQIKNNINSITGQYLSGAQYIPIPALFRTGHDDKQIILTGAKSNNLCNISISITLGAFTAITGVSGSGKSSLILHTFYKAILKSLDPKSKIIPGEYKSIKGVEHIDKIIDINQSPIGRTPRSNPATYTGAFTPIRDLFTELPESKLRGYKVGRFSFNVKGGRCEACRGDGLVKIEMHFLPDVYINCDVCNGQRYNSETLEVKYQNKNISDILQMRVDEATIFFKEVPLIYEKLITLQEVGLGYIKIGQPATTLSGGEAQRVKLAKELSKRSTGKTLYILDEPTTGLHAHDIKKLLKVIHQLVDKGNTLIVIEHNMDVIKTADYIIDIGPEGGDKGGEIVIEGRPDIVSQCKASYTGMYLKRCIERTRAVQEKST